MAFKTKKTEAITNVCISSVGVCLATSEDKKKPSCLVVAYKVEEKIKFVATAYPVNKEYDTLTLTVNDSWGDEKIPLISFDFN